MNTIILIVIYLFYGYVTVLCAINIDDEYIIRLKNGTNTNQFIRQCFLKSENGDLTPLNTLVKHIYREVFDGFSAKLDKTQLKSLQNYNEIEFIEKNQIAKVCGASSLNSEWLTQIDVTWGLARISANEKLIYRPYNYKFGRSGGNGVTVYVIDTGVYIQHKEFGGRAVKGANFVTKESDKDLSGHGTHVAATIAGRDFGVAKNAKIIDVKVLDARSVGDWVNIIAGLEWAIKNATSKRSVINMSLVGSGYLPMDKAIQSAVRNGITTVVAAGNKALDACKYSPARAPLAITVAYSDINDKSGSETNYGSCIDLYAPGEDIKSAQIGTPTSTKLRVGTSMASAHVAGLAAYLIAEYNLKSPDEVMFVINKFAIKDVLTGVPVYTKNLLAHNNYNTTPLIIPTISTTPIISNIVNSSCIEVKFDTILSLISMLIFILYV